MHIEIVTPIEHIKYSIALAIQGARLAKKSGEQSDSNIPFSSRNYDVVIGKKDMVLGTKLAITPIGSGHDKFLQSIYFMVDITWARYMWQEFDTYRLGVTKQSESTIHTLLQDVTNLSITDFEVSKELYPDTTQYTACMGWIEQYITFTKTIHNLVESEAEKRRILKMALPESYLQTRRVSMNYATMKTIYSQRKAHIQPEWRIFCEYMKTKLPHSELFTFSTSEDI